VRRKVPKVGDFPGLHVKVTEATVADLARKYRALAALRSRRDGGGPAATRDELRALATEFPGCLRELDTLGAAETARRVDACAGAAAGAPSEPWMAWIAAYHALVTRALGARAGRAERGARERAAAEGFEAAALAPPEGRVNVVVLREIGARFGVSPEAVAAALFPVRRASPYKL
jgi:hypothetical protein